MSLTFKKLSMLAVSLSLLGSVPVFANDDLMGGTKEQSSHKMRAPQTGENEYSKLLHDLTEENIGKASIQMYHNLIENLTKESSALKEAADSGDKIAQAFLLAFPLENNHLEAIRQQVISQDDGSFTKVQNLFKDADEDQLIKNMHPETRKFVSYVKSQVELYQNAQLEIKRKVEEMKESGLHLKYPEDFAANPVFAFGSEKKYKEETRVPAFLEGMIPETLLGKLF